MQPLKYEVPPSVFFYASVWKALVVHFHACLSVQREHNKNQHNVDHNLKSVKATSNSAPIFGWDCTSSDVLFVPTFNIYPRFIKHFDVQYNHLYIWSKRSAMRIKGATGKLQHFLLLMDQAAVCTLCITFNILPIENDETRIHTMPAG